MPNKMIDQIRRLAQIPEKSAEKLFDDFFDIYEPIFFESNEMIDGLHAFDRPFKELIAAHQAWGMISSDGFDNYFQITDEQFDIEVKNGLDLLGIMNSYEALLEARDLYIKHNGDIPDNDDFRLVGEFYNPIKNFESLAGQFLINKYRKA